MIDLIGHTINKVVYNEEEQTLSLTVDDNKIFLIEVEADCCSSGKFLSVDEPYDLPSKVVSEEDRQETFDRNYGDYTIYQRTLTLENGNKIYILYDNESNGYYGSSLDAYYNGERLWEFPTVVQQSSNEN